MLIEIYRNRVREAYDELLQISDPPERKEMDAYVRGDLSDFYDRYYDDDREQWWTDGHLIFYHACAALKRAEAEEYRRAMQWVPA